MFYFVRQGYGFATDSESIYALEKVNGRNVGEWGEEWNDGVLLLLWMMLLLLLLLLSLLLWML